MIVLIMTIALSAQILEKKEVDKDGITTTYSTKCNEDECVLHGKWVERFPNGNLRLEAEYENDIKTGNWTWYFEKTGTPKMGGPFVNGKQHGTWTRWFPEGKIWDQGKYCDDLPCGMWVYNYREQDQVRAILYWKKGKLHGHAIEWFPNGNKAAEGDWEMDKRVGTWTWWDNTGKVLKKVTF